MVIKDIMKLSSGGSNAMFEAPDGATKRLVAAMQLHPLGGAWRVAAPQTALAALNVATGTGATTLRLADTPTAYGELESGAILLSPADDPAARRQPHGGGFLLSGRVRERLQQAFGFGGDAYIVPGRPHLGVRSALFDSDASDGWNYEALQRSDAKRRFLPLRLQRDFP